MVAVIKMIHAANVLSVMHLGSIKTGGAPQGSVLDSALFISFCFAHSIQMIILMH